MKKLLGILVLGLLWCNISSADELIKIPVHVHIIDFFSPKNATISVALGIKVTIFLFETLTTNPEPRSLKAFSFLPLICDHSAIKAILTSF